MYSKFKKYFFIEIKSKKGDSGGIISNQNGNIIGTHFSGDEYSRGFLISSKKMLDLVRFAKQSLESKI